MKKVLSFIGAALASLSLGFAQAPQQETLQKSDNATSLRNAVTLPAGFTYADRSAAAAGKIITIGTRAAGVYIAGGIELPVAAGVTIKGISYFCESDDAYGKVFIASRDASSAAGKYTILQVAQGETKKNAMTKVDFATPVATEDGKVYVVGYEAKQTATNGLVLSFIADEHLVSKASFVAFNNTASLVGDAGAALAIEDLSEGAFGSLAIVVHYDDPQGKYDRLVMLNTPSLADIRKVGATLSAEEAKFPIQIRNLGGKEISKVSLQVKKADGSSEEKDIDVSIASESNGAAIYEAGEITAPRGSFEFNLKNVNGAANSITEAPLLKTKVAYQLYPEGSLLRYKILIERFTTEKCGQCPSGDQRLQEAYKEAGKKGISLVIAAHHAGFYTDFLTLKQSQELLPYFVAPGTSSFAPAFSISRLNDSEMKRASGDKNPGMYIGVAGAEQILRQLEIAYQIFSEAKILRIAQEETGEGVRSITITGKVFGSEAKDDTYLSIYRTEDGIPAQSQAGAGAGFKHDNAIREFITPTFGQKVTVDDKGDFSITIENVKVNKDWSNEMMRFVVFIHRDIKNKDEKMRYAYAAEAIGVHTMLGTREVAPELQPVAYAIEGRIFINGAFDSFVVYDVAGRIVANNSDTVLPAGLYIVKSRLGDIDYISKVVVN